MWYNEEHVRGGCGDEVGVEPHRCIGGWNYMPVFGDSAREGFELVFETDGKRVTGFRGGRLPEVKWVEGCR